MTNERIAKLESTLRRVQSFLCLIAPALWVAKWCDECRHLISAIDEVLGEKVQ